jgi:hypothetical protein
MKIFYSISIVLLLFISCKPEKLNPGNLKKVLLVKIHYVKNTFSSGKEFSYFKELNNSDSIQTFVYYTEPNPEGRLTILYGLNKDTIFDGTEIIDGKGEILYPKNMDYNLFYYKQEYNIDKPADSIFQLLYVPNGVPVLYDSIWKAVSNLRIVENYRKSNPKSKIGLFLHRPSLVAQNPGDWRWYLIFKE